jgi:hypothetical protein
MARRDGAAPFQAFRAAEPNWPPHPPLPFPHFRSATPPSYRSLGRTFQCDGTTAKHRLGAFEEFMRTGAIPKPVKPKPTGLSEDLAKHFIVYQLIEDPTRSVREISRTMKRCNFVFAVGKSCISRYIARMGITNDATIKRPRLTERHLEAREQFAHGIELDIRYHLPWFFTDESSLDLNPYRRTAYRIPGITTLEGMFQDYTKHPLRIMVWGGIARNYKSPLILVEGFINAEKYIQMLDENQVIEHLDGIHGRGGWVFQDDGASPHRARVTKAWLNERCRNVTGGELAWPANSPDLNPIEQMWAIVKQGIDPEGVSTREELFTRAQRA